MTCENMMKWKKNKRRKLQIIVVWTCGERVLIRMDYNRQGHAIYILSLNCVNLHFLIIIYLQKTQCKKLLK